MPPTATEPVTASGGQALLAFDIQGWIDENTGALIGVPLRILVILIAALIVRAIARRAITRVVQRALEATERPEKDEEERASSRRRRGAAVLQRSQRASERRQQRAKTIGSVLSSFATIVIAVMALAMILDQLGIALGPLLASAGVVGLAIGFGAQSLVADYLAGILIMMEDQYGVGDVVDLGEAVGEVEDVGLRLTRVRDLHGGLWFVRNGEILRVRNDSQDWARAVLDVRVAYDSDLDEVREVLEDAGRKMRQEPEWSDILLDDLSFWGVQSLDSDAMLVRVAVTTVPLEQWGVARELRRRAKTALDGAGVEIPFQQRTIWMRAEDSDGKTRTKSAYSKA